VRRPLPFACAVPARRHLVAAEWPEPAPLEWRWDAQRNGQQDEWCGAEREMRRRGGEGTRPDGEKEAGTARKSGLDAERDEGGAVESGSLGEKNGPRAERSALPGKEGAHQREGSGLQPVKSRFDGE
jgi:hypothetical protein